MKKIKVNKNRNFLNLNIKDKFIKDIFILVYYLFYINLFL